MQNNTFNIQISTKTLIFLIKYGKLNSEDLKMKYSEFKEELENSLIYEFFGKIFRFLKQYKFMSILLLVAFVSLALLFAPILNRSSHPNEKQGSETILIKDENFINYVTVCVSGEVKNPGTYTLTDEQRVEDAIESAGGLTQNAYTKNINFAQRLTDEQYIYIQSVEEAENSQKVPTSSGKKSQFSGIVNINTATAAELSKLPGIGEVTASRIIEYRTNVGPFTDTRDIMNVEGIGTALYEKIKNNITI